MKHRMLALLLALSLLVIPAVGAAGAQAGGFDVKFSGVITAVPAAAGLPWTIGGFIVNTTPTTQVILDGVTKAKTGLWADVTARKTDVAGTYEALKIVVRAAKPATATEDDEITVYGPIDSFSDTQWTIDGKVFSVTEDTKIMGTPKFGLLALGVGTKTTSGIEGKLLKVTWNEPKRGWGPAQFKGVIEAMPEGLIGEWTISGRKVEVTGSTIIQQNKAKAEVGGTVHVVIAPPAKYGDSDANPPVATLIQVLTNASGARDQEKGKPELKGKPEDKGKPELNGKPEGTGKPDVVGKPDGVGKPEVVGKPDGVGKPDTAGRPDSAGKPGKGPKH